MCSVVLISVITESFVPLRARQRAYLSGRLHLKNNLPLYSFDITKIGCWRSVVQQNIAHGEEANPGRSVTLTSEVVCLRPYVAREDYSDATRRCLPSIQYEDV